MPDDKVSYEEFRVNGEAVVGKVKEILHEGNIRRITIKNEKGDTLIEIPLTVGVVGVILLPVWAALGALAALAANLTIVVEKENATHLVDLVQRHARQEAFETLRVRGARRVHEGHFGPDRAGPLDADAG